MARQSKIKENLSKTFKNNEKEVGKLVGKISFEKKNKKKTPKKIISFRPNGPRIRDPRIKLSLFPIFHAERSLIAPFSVTSSVPHKCVLVYTKVELEYIF